MVDRKKPYQKNLRISAKDRERAKFLREAEELGLTDSDIYGEGLNAYETKLETIRRELAARDARGPPPKIKPAVPAHILESMEQREREQGRDELFPSREDAYMKVIGAKKETGLDRFGFKKYPEVKQPGPEHALDNIYEGSYYAGGSPDPAMLEHNGLTLENWWTLMESERLFLVSLWKEKLRG